MSHKYIEFYVGIKKLISVDIYCTTIRPEKFKKRFKLKNCFAGFLLLRHFYSLVNPRHESGLLLTFLSTFFSSYFASCLSFSMPTKSFEIFHFNLNWWIELLILCFQSRLKPGRMLLVDTEMKSLIQDVELKTKISKSRPYGEWLKQQVIEELFEVGCLLRTMWESFVVRDFQSNRKIRFSVDSCQNVFENVF